MIPGTVGKCELLTNLTLPSPTCPYPHRPAPILTNLPLPSLTCPYPHRSAPILTNLPSHHQPAPTLTNLPLSSPTCPYPHRPAPILTNLPLSSPTCPYPHQPAPPLANLPQPTPTCLYPHQPAPTPSFSVPCACSPLGVQVVTEPPSNGPTEIEKLVTASVCEEDCNSKEGGGRTASYFLLMCRLRRVGFLTDGHPGC